MFVYMQAYVEIMLVAILVVILFNGPISGLSDFANSVLGKAVMVCLIIVVAHQFGTNAGLLMATITVVLLNKNIEGFTGKEGIASANSTDTCEDNPDSCADTKVFAGDASQVEGSQAGKKRDKREQDTAPGALHTAHGRQGGDLNGKDRAKKFTKAAAVASGTTGKGVATVARPVEEKKVVEVKDPVKDKPKEEERPLTKPDERPVGRPVEEPKKERFSNYTLDNAADYTNLGSTLAAYSTNDNIMSSMRASEYAKTAPGGCALMTNHIDTMKVVNNPSSEGIF